MRIVAGEYGSRKIETLKGEQTRPTLDKVREAVFSSLGGMFDGGTVLDLYAGSGAIGLEALSRGFEKAYFSDSSKEAVAVIKKNIASLRADEKCRVFCMKDEACLARLKESGVKLDLVYLDPPYAKQKNMEILKRLDEFGLMNSEGRVVIESLKEDEQEDEIGCFTKYKSVVYGITRISYYKLK